LDARVGILRTEESQGRRGWRSEERIVCAFLVAALLLVAAAAAVGQEKRRCTGMMEAANAMASSGPSSGFSIARWIQYKSQE
jgi:hypothetical protein